MEVLIGEDDVLNGAGCFGFAVDGLGEKFCSWSLWTGDCGFVWEGCEGRVSLLRGGGGGVECGGGGGGNGGVGGGGGSGGRIGGEGCVNFCRL